MKTLIAPIDFSAQSENAALFAAKLAEFYGADLILYHTYEVVMPISEYAFPFVSLPELQNAAEFELEELKTKVQAKLRRKLNMEIKVEYNSLDEGLKNLCEERKPDFVVMGLSGKNKLTQLVVGSNTIKAIHHLNYPILVVPPGAQFIPIRKVGFACDYKQIIDSTPIEPLKKLIRDFNADLHVMNVDTNFEEQTPEEVAKESAGINKLLHEFNPEYHKIVSLDITDGINSFAEKAKLDFIVVIPRKHNLIDKIFKRSNTKDLIYHTNTPVLCMHE